MTLLEPEVLLQREAASFGQVDRLRTEAPPGALVAAPWETETLWCVALLFLAGYGLGTPLCFPNGSASWCFSILAIPALWAGVAGLISPTTLGTPSALINIVARVPLAPLVAVPLGTLAILFLVLSSHDPISAWVHGMLGERMPGHFIVLFLVTQCFNAYLWLVGRHLPRAYRTAGRGL